MQRQPSKFIDGFIDSLISEDAQRRNKEREFNNIKHLFDADLAIKYPFTSAHGRDSHTIEELTK